MRLIHRPDLIGTENGYYCGLKINKQLLNLHHISAVTGICVSKLGFQMAKLGFTDAFDFYFKSKLGTFKQAEFQLMLLATDEIIMGIKKDPLYVPEFNSYINRSITMILKRLDILGVQLPDTITYCGYMRVFEEDLNGQL